MPEAQKGPTTSIAVIAIIASLLSGGAMGAFISHYYSTRKTVISYSHNTTSLGTGEATNVLPGLKLQLNGVEIPAVYTHTVELSHDSGPELERSSVGLTYKNAILLGPPVAYGPDPVHQIDCKLGTVNQIICSIGRISSNSGTYKIVVATGQVGEVNIGIDGNNAQLHEIQRPGTEHSAADKVVPIANIAILSLVVLFMIFELLARFLRARLK
jgi:hypothetical protein